MRWALWAAGPPADRPRAREEFERARTRMVRDGKEYARLTTGQDKLIENLRIMLEWEGWADVQILREAG